MPESDLCRGRNRRPLQQSQRLRGEGVQGVVQDDQEGGLVVYRVGGQAVVGVVSACVVIAPEQVYRDRRGALNEGVGLAVKVLVALGAPGPRPPGSSCPGRLASPWA